MKNIRNFSLIPPLIILSFHEKCLLDTDEMSYYVMLSENYKQNNKMSASAVVIKL